MLAGLRSTTLCSTRPLYFFILGQTVATPHSIQLLTPLCAFSIVSSHLVAIVDPPDADLNSEQG